MSLRSRSGTQKQINSSVLLSTSESWHEVKLQVKLPSLDLHVSNGVSCSIPRYKHSPH